MPPAFNLSQDQTLRFNPSNRKRSTTKAAPHLLKGAHTHRLSQIVKDHRQSRNVTLSNSNTSCQYLIAPQRILNEEKNLEQRKQSLTTPQSIPVLQQHVTMPYPLSALRSKRATILSCRRCQPFPAPLPAALPTALWPPIAGRWPGDWLLRRCWRWCRWPP